MEDYFYKNLLIETIDESLGISDDLKIHANNIIQKLFDNFKEKWNTRKKYDCYSKFEGSIKEIINSTKVSIFYYCYNFTNKNDYENFKYKYIFDEGRSVYYNGINHINLNVLSISGKIDNNKLFDTLFHELEHMYQEIQAKHLLPTSKYYSRAISDLNSKDKIIKNIAKCVYFSFKFEQDGFINGLYGELMSLDNKIPIVSFETLRTTTCYQTYLEYNKSLDYIIKNRNNTNIEHILKQYGYKDTEKFIIKNKKLLKEFLKKIGKVIIKYCDDLRNDVGMTYPKSGIHGIYYIE